MTHRPNRSSPTSGAAHIEAFHSWYKNLKRYHENFPAKGTVAGALVVLDRLKAAFDLNIDSHTAKGLSQIKGASGAAVKRILARFGETRPFLGEGGRTNRGLRGDIKGMLDAIAGMQLDELSSKQRIDVLAQLQGYLVDRVADFHSQRRLECKYVKSQSAYQFVSAILAAARERGKEGPVAQYLVGAKLALRFPGELVENKSYSTADAPQEKPGDFLLGDTVFHVTVAPMSAVLEKSDRNIGDSLRPWLLVPERLVALFRQEAETYLHGPFTLSSIEGFVSQNVAELAGFSDELEPVQLLQLLDTYNQRVGEVDLDRTMLIETPVALLRLESKQRT
jgi:Domain of unknown function (DUF4928)